jgi:aspartyl protease/PDZ domain-containing protein
VYRNRFLTIVAALAITLGALIPLSNRSAAGLHYAQAPVASANKPVATIPFKLVTRHIVVQVKVNDSRPLSFIFDTGDKVGIIDIERAGELGLSLQGQIRVGGAGADTLLGAYVRGATWKLQGFEEFSQPLTMAIPLGRMAARFGHDFDGIIGSDFIKQFVVEVDYQARVLKLHDKEKFVYAGSGETVPIKLDGHGYPIIEAEVTPQRGPSFKGKFILDLGSGGALALHSPTVKEHRLLESNDKTIRVIGAGGAGGATFGRLGRISELRIGRFKFAGPPVLFSEDKAGAFASSALAGNIGQRIAGKFKVFLDYEHERIVLEPTAALNAPFDQANSGLALTTEGKDYSTFRVTDVLENSPASEAGLLKDDVIVKVDNRSVSEIGITGLGEMFEKSKTYRLTIRRGDKTTKVQLSPRKLI